MHILSFDIYYPDKINNDFFIILSNHCKHLKCLDIDDSNLKEIIFNDLSFLPPSILFNNITDLKLIDCTMNAENLISLTNYYVNL